MKACLLLLIITFGVLCVPVEGCMKGGVPPISTGAIIALCVVFSPVILVVGTGYVVKETVPNAVRSIHRKRVTSNLIRKQRNRVIKKIGAKKFDSYLQDLHDKTKTEPSPGLFTEYGTALFLNNDMIHAHEWLSKAESTFKANPTGEFKTRGSALFMRGMVNQYLYDFVQAIEDFQEAQKYLTSTRTVTGEGGAEIPQLTIHDAINATGFAKMMQALYSVDCHTKEPAEINALLTDAIKDITTAIETTPDMQGMYFHNRGFTRYHRSYLVPETEVARELELAVLDFDQAINSGNFGTTAEGHSMKSQCLTRLGRIEEGKEEQTRAIELDEKVFTVELRDEAAMRVPWPLPKDKFKDNKSNHNFQEVSFSMPHYCTHCGELIRKGKGFECWVCNFRCHPQCHPKVAKQDCWEAMKNESVRISFIATSTDEELPLNSHIHHLKATHFHKPTWCDLCTKIVASPFGKQGYRCTDCGAKMHKGCLQHDGAHIIEEN